MNYEVTFERGDMRVTVRGTDLDGVARLVERLNEAPTGELLDLPKIDPTLIDAAAHRVVVQ